MILISREWRKLRRGEAVFAPATCKPWRTRRDVRATTIEDAGSGVWSDVYYFQMVLRTCRRWFLLVLRVIVTALYGGNSEKNVLRIIPGAGTATSPHARHVPLGQLSDPSHSNCQTPAKTDSGTWECFFAAPTTTCAVDSRSAQSLAGCPHSFLTPTTF